MDSNSLDTVINLATVALVAGIWIPLQKWLRQRMHRVAAGITAAVIVISSVAAFRAGIEVLRQQNPAVVDEALGQWKVFVFLKDHEPALYEDLRAQIKARWPMQSDAMYALGHQFWQKSGATIIAKYAKHASDDSTLGFYRFQEQVMRQLHARTDSACYLFLHNHPRAAQLAAETVSNYNRLTDAVAGELFRSGAERPQPAPNSARVEQVLEIVGDRLRKRIGEEGARLIGEANLSSPAEQKRACAGYIAFVEEILKLDRATASAVLRSFWQ